MWRGEVRIPAGGPPSPVRDSPEAREKELTLRTPCRPTHRESQGEQAKRRRGRPQDFEREVLDSRHIHPGAGLDHGSSGASRRDRSGVTLRIARRRDGRDRDRCHDSPPSPPAARTNRRAPREPSDTAPWEAMSGRDPASRRTIPSRDIRALEASAVHVGVSSVARGRPIHDADLVPDLAFRTVHCTRNPRLQRAVLRRAPRATIWLDPSIPHQAASPLDRLGRRSFPVRFRSTACSVLQHRCRHLACTRTSVSRRVGVTPRGPLYGHDRRAISRRS